MGLGWVLTFKVNDVEADVACPWISHEWFDLRGHYCNKMTAAAHVRAEAAKAALKTEAAARKELLGIRAHSWAVEWNGKTSNEQRLRSNPSR